MEEKLKKISNILQKRIRKFNTVSEVFDSLREIAKDQSDYFNKIGPQDFIKLVFYIYSLKKTNDFSLGEKMLFNVGFSQLLISQNEIHIYTCSDCEGSGVVDCDVCYGGRVTCKTCDGEGEIEDDDEEDEVITCPQCDGEGETDCPNCSNSGFSPGEVLCEKCDGNGEIQSENEYDYELYFIMSWNKNLNDICEINQETQNPIMSNEELYEFQDDFVTLSITSDHAPLDVIADEVYCLNYSDEPKMVFGGSFHIVKLGSVYFDLHRLFQ
jgi:hypothetical protein